jgi:hypothetical protein
VWHHAVVVVDVSLVAVLTFLSKSGAGAGRRFHNNPAFLFHHILTLSTVGFFMQV